MLLNEMQLQQKALTAKLDAQATEIDELKTQLAALNELKTELQAALRELKPTGRLVARR
jgi:prefoldin subunit 5